MSDVERLRQEVINAARRYKNAIHRYDKPMRVSVPNDEGADEFFAAHNHMIRTLAALDEAEAPDPWMLLREAQLHIDVCVEWLPDQTDHGHKLRIESERIANRIEAALAWKENQND